MNCNNMNSRSMYTRDHNMRFYTEQKPLAMAYVPMQSFGRTYELEQALSIGTIFPELNKPFCGKGVSR